MSIVNFIFNESAQKLLKPLHEFTDTELALFATQSEASPENSFLKAVDPDRKRFKKGIYPWHGCLSWKSCYAKLLDPNDPIIYMPVFEVRYYFI